MKFGKDLQQNVVGRWADHYLDYKGLKQLLKPSEATEQEKAASFWKALEQNLMKINSFYLAQIKAFEARLDGDETAAANDGIYGLYRELGDFQSYVWINGEGFRRIIKKFDKNMGYRGTPKQQSLGFEQRLQQQPFMSKTRLTALTGQVQALAQGENKAGLKGALSTGLPRGRMGMPLAVMAGTAHRKLAEEVSAHMNVPLVPTLIKRFADGEIFIQIQETIRDSDVFLIQPTCNPVNDNLMELLLTIGALRRASAGRITAVIPYYGYARQDRKDRPRVTISAADTARLLETMGVDHIVCIDLHADQIQGFFGPRVPVDNLFASPIAMQYFADMKLKNCVVVSPDAGGVKRSAAFRAGLDSMGVPAELAMIAKQRKKAVGENVANQEIAHMDLVGQVKGCDCIIVDDMIDTAGTLCAAANEIKKMGALRVFAFATHGLFNGAALDRIEASALEEVCVANTMPLQSKIKQFSTKIKQLSVGPLLAETINRLHWGVSVNPGSLASEMVRAEGGASSWHARL